MGIFIRFTVEVVPRFCEFWKSKTGKYKYFPILIFHVKHLWNILLKITILLENYKLIHSSRY